MNEDSIKAIELKIIFISSKLFGSIVLLENDQKSKYLINTVILIKVVNKLIDLKIQLILRLIKSDIILSLFTLLERF
jgi:hypothetical protein